MEKKMIAIRVTEAQKKSMEEKAGDKSLTQYLIDCALSESSGGGGFARENTEESEVIAYLTERFGGVQAFVDRLVYKLDMNGERSVYKWLEEEGQGRPQASHPFFGYTVATIRPDLRRVMVTNGGREVPISDETDNEELLVWFFDAENQPYYKVGDVIGKELPFKKQ